MPSDPSIYGLIKQQPGPIEQYGQVLNLKQLMGQGRLQELQTGKLEGDIAEETAAKDYLKGLAPGVDPTSDVAISGLRRVAPTRAMQYQKDALAAKETQGKIAHTGAQTKEITAGHIAGAWGALAKGGGSDESVKNAEAMMAELIGPEKAAAATQKLLAMPPENRLAYAVAQAGAHKVGQDALKLFFPDAGMQDTGGAITPVSKSTLPGGMPAGSPIPGSVPLAKTQTPESVASNATSQRGQDLVDARSREAAVAAAGNQSVNTEGKLRDDYNRISQDFVKVRDAHQRVLASAKDPSAAGDLALIFNYMKVLDPGSTVREGEFATAQNSGGVDARIAGMYNKVINGERLADKVRADFVDRSGRLYQSAESNQKTIEQQFTEIAKRSRANPENVIAPQRVVPNEPAGSAAKAPGRIVPAKGSVQDGYKFKGGDPGKAESWEKV